MILEITYGLQPRIVTIYAMNREPLVIPEAEFNRILVELMEIAQIFEKEARANAKPS